MAKTKIEIEFEDRLEKAGIDNIDQLISDISESKLASKVKEELLDTAEAVKNELIQQTEEKKDVVVESTDKKGNVTKKSVSLPASVADSKEELEEQEASLSVKAKTVPPGTKAVRFTSIDQMNEWQKDKKLVGYTYDIPKKGEKVSSGVAIIKAAIIGLLFIFGSFGVANQAFAVQAKASTDKGYLGADAWVVDSDGDIVPLTDSALDIGASGSEVDNIYADSLWLGGTELTVSTIHASEAATALTPGTTVTLTVSPGLQLFTDTITTDNQDQTINASGPGSAGDVMVIKFVTDAAGSGDEVITFGTNFLSTGTLTLANLASDVYVVSFMSDGTTWFETSRTAVQTT